MLKGFTHARLACGCRITFRDGVVQVCRYIFDKSSAVKGSKRRDYDAEKNPRGIDASLQAMAFDAYATWKKGSRRRFKIHHGDVGM